ncbi:MAG: protein translocase subunit SecD [Acidimicrobiales bacterium]
MKGRAATPLIAIVVIVGALLAGSLIAGQEPLLGLDLQGGVEVVLEPVDNPGDEVTGEELDQALEIIRDRVDALGVAEPDITRQGDRIVIQLPGVDDQERAIELVGQTAELRFRPVLVGPLPLSGVPAVPDETLDPEPSHTEPVVCSDLILEGVDMVSDGYNGGPSLAQLETGFVTSPANDLAGRTVILDGEAGRYLLGPACVTGAALEGASAELQGVQWAVRVTARSGPDGIDRFNDAASTCFAAIGGICPAVPGDQVGALAIVLDGQVQSAPRIQAASFDRDNINITGSFSQAEARDIALVLDFGALPVEFTDPATTGLVRTVSATLGRDALDAGLLAGAIGVAIVAAYMIAYYRLLGVGAILSLIVSSAMLWVIVSFLSDTRGLALTLAGITGLIVSIGVSLDSNIVYFEHLKEDILRGRSLTSSIDRSFPAAFRTIFWANLATLIGAVILYFLTIGSVRGFALMLGIASILDLVATYFFLRPFVRILVLSKRFSGSNRAFGMPPDTEVEAVTA